MFFASLELNPYKFKQFIIDNAFAAAMDVLIKENLPGPWLTNILFNLLGFIPVSLKKLKSSIENFSLLFLLGLIILW